MFSLKPLEARVQSFGVLCIPTGGTHITLSDMCAGIHIVTGGTQITATRPLMWSLLAVPTPAKDFRPGDLRAAK